MQFVTSPNKCKGVHQVRLEDKTSYEQSSWLEEFLDLLQLTKQSFKFSPSVSKGKYKVA